MPSFVIAEKCDGCKGGDKTACMYICPNDLMVLDKDGLYSAFMGCFTFDRHPVIAALAAHPEFCKEG